MRAINAVKKLPIKEADTLKLIRDYLKVLGFFVVRMQAGMGVHKGIPDLYFIGHGLQGWIETKAPKGKMSSHQIAFRDEVMARGAYFIEAHSLDDVMSVMRDCGVQV